MYQLERVRVVVEVGKVMDVGKGGGKEGKGGGGEVVGGLVFLQGAEGRWEWGGGAELGRDEGEDGGGGCGKVER